jgi:hypothetical protein
MVSSKMADEKMQERRMIELYQTICYMMDEDNTIVIVSYHPINTRIIII